MSDAPLTVAVVSTERRWQGGEEQARQLARGLRRAGHRCLFAALRDGALAARMDQEGFEVLGLSGRSAWPHRCWAAAAPIAATASRHRALQRLSGHFHRWTLGMAFGSHRDGGLTTSQLSHSLSNSIQLALRSRLLCVHSRRYVVQECRDSRRAFEGCP